MRFPGFTEPWQKFALGDLGTSVIGLTYSPKDVVQENGIIVLRSSNIQDGALDFNDVVRVSKKIRPSLFTQEDDILICSRNGSARLIGKNAIIPKSFSGLTFGAFMMVYRSNQNRFIHHLLNTKRYQTQVSENLGARINQITSSDLNSFEFFFPCEKEQNKISKFIDLIDERIATQRRLIEDLKKLKSAIRNKIFADLKNLDTVDVEISELLVYEQPNSYIVTSDEYIFDSTKTPVLTANKGFILGYTEEKFGIYQKGDCIIFDDFTMDAKYVTFPFKVKSSAIKILTAKSNVNLRFMFEYLQNMELKSEEHKRHYISEIATLVVAIPTIDMQNRFAYILDSIDSKMAIEQQIAKEYEKERLFLISNMFI